MKQPVLLVAGGDLRQRYAAERLQQLLPDWHVETAGLSGTADMPAKPEPYAALVLPIPASQDGETVAAPFGKTPLSVEKLLRLGTPGALVLGGNIGESLQKKLETMGFEQADYLKREELCLRNAIPTAEGALQIAMEETAAAIHGRRALLIGYGRISMALAPRLRAMGAAVTVCARRCDSRAQAELLGLRAVPMEQLAQEASEADLIFNTVPALVLDASVLEQIRPDALVLDLASRPGGTDFVAAKRLGTKVVWALSLPPKRRGCHKWQRKKIWEDIGKKRFAKKKIVKKAQKPPEYPSKNFKKNRRMGLTQAK